MSVVVTVDVTSDTMRVQFIRLFGAGMLLAFLWLSGCGDSNPPLYATLTLRDGSHFAGTVVRREANSLTITGIGGDTHTFLYTELSHIEYGAPDNPTGTPVTATPATDSGASNKTGSSRPTPSGAATIPASGVIQFPEGTEFPVRTNGFLDSCCVPIGANSLGLMDADVKDSKGNVLIPQGASVVIVVREEKKVDGVISMTFELGSADFEGRHFLISSAKGGLEPGARVTFTGAREGSAEAKSHGVHVHLEDQTYMGFKAETPVNLRVSQ